MTLLGSILAVAGVVRRSGGSGAAGAVETQERATGANALIVDVDGNGRVVLALWAYIIGLRMEENPERCLYSDV